MQSTRKRYQAHIKADPSPYPFLDPPEGFASVSRVLAVPVLIPLSVGELHRGHSAVQCYRRGFSTQCWYRLERRGGALLSLYITSGPSYPICRKVNTPNLDVSSAIILGPDIQNVLAAADTQHCTTDFLTSLHKLVANNGEQQIFPVSVCYSLFEPYYPLAPPFVRFVFPYWSNPLLEYVVIRNRRQL